MARDTIAALLSATPISFVSRQATSWSAAYFSRVLTTCKTRLINVNDTNCAIECTQKRKLHMACTTQLATMPAAACASEGRQRVMQEDLSPVATPALAAAVAERVGLAGRAASRCWRVVVWGRKSHFVRQERVQNQKRRAAAAPLRSPTLAEPEEVVEAEDFGWGELLGDQSTSFPEDRVRPCDFEAVEDRQHGCE